ncbi:MAG: hypothetical protein ACI9U2_001523 [Bradymonadia bacterium]|jgi:hypothetical protein
MKFFCPCGHLIRDQTDDLPHKARLRSDADAGEYWDRLDAEVLKALHQQMQVVGLMLPSVERWMYE